MAEVAEGASFTDPATAISQGRRHLLVRDYSSAVSALSQACDLLARQHGDTSDELGEPYLLYGRALLGLAREEAGVLGGGLPGSSEDKEDADEEDDEEEENDDAGEEDEEADGEEQKEGEVVEKESGEGSSQQPESVDSKKEVGGESQTDVKDGDANGSASTNASDSNKTDDSKIAEQKSRTKDLANGQVASSSSASAGMCEPTTSQNGEGGSEAEAEAEAEAETEDGTEDLTKEDEDDGVNNLQVAWEVLELAKLVLLKRGPPGWKLLAESYRLLGEVAMEGGNHQGALTDLQGCLNLLEKIEPREPRAIAEIHYQLGLAHSLANDFDASIEQFNQATSLLEARIKELEETKVPSKSDDPFYTVEGEIQELKDLLPEIQEKITDMRDFKQEACKLVIEGIKNKVANGDGSGAGPSGQSSELPKVQKPASDISHLVRKKRKADEPELDTSSPLKKPTPEKAV